MTELPQEATDSDLPYVFMLIIVIGAGLYTIYNRFMPLGEGLFSVYYKLVESGKIPYRDFYLFIPPLHVFVVGWFQKIFGQELVNLRAFGALIMLSETVLIFYSFRYHFDRLIALVSTFVCAVFYFTYAAYIMHDYNDFINLFITALIFILHLHSKFKFFREPTSSYPAQAVSARYRTSKRTYTPLLVGGLLTGLILLEKQNLGPLVFLAVCFYIFRYSGEKWKSFGIFVAGAAIPVMILLQYLIGNDALASFIDNVYLTVGQKGATLWEIVGRAFQATLAPKILASTLAIFIGAYLVRRTWYKPNQEEVIVQPPPSLMGKGEGTERLQGDCLSPARLWDDLLHAAAFSGLVSCGYFLWESLKPIADTRTFHQAINLIPYLVFTSSLVLLALVVLTRGKDHRLVASFLLPSSVFLVSSVMSSGAVIPLFPAFLSAGYMAGYIINHMNETAKYIFILSCGAFLAILVAFKYYSPYGFGIDARWWGTGEQVPVAQATYPLHSPVLKGLFSGPDLGMAIDKISDYLVQQHVKPGDLLCYPLNAVFYLTTSTLPKDFYSPTFLYDISNSRYMEKDLRQFVSNPPRYVVWTRYHNYEDLIAHENVYNGGRQFNTHRELIDIFNEEYTPALSFRVEDNMDLQLLIRKGKPNDLAIRQTGHGAFSVANLPLDSQYPLAERDAGSGQVGVNGEITIRFKNLAIHKAVGKKDVWKGTRYYIVTYTGDINGIAEELRGLSINFNFLDYKISSVGMQVFVGTVLGEKGTFTAYMRQLEMADSSKAAKAIIISGTGDLSDLQGTLSFIIYPLKDGSYAGTYSGKLVAPY